MRLCKSRLLEARRVFRADLPPAAGTEIEFFDADRYNAAASVQDNILFGKIAYGEADALGAGSRSTGRRHRGRWVCARRLSRSGSIITSGPAARDCRWLSASWSESRAPS